MSAEFLAAPLSQPISYRTVAEGDYIAAYADEQVDHLVTLGIYTCKAITVHNRDTQYGVLAHLDGTTHPNTILQTVLNAYGDKPSTADIKIVQATIHPDEFLWPTVETLANLFMRYNPRDLAIDYNRTKNTIRGVALDLKSGAVHEVGHNSAVFKSSDFYPERSKSLR